MGREREITETRSRALKLWDDTTAEERAYSRSIKIRMGVLEFMGHMADYSEEGRPVPWATMEDLSDYAGNYVETSGWDVKPAGSVASGRWARQYLRGNGYFKPQNMGHGTFMISWRGGEETKERWNRTLREYRRKK